MITENYQVVSPAFNDCKKASDAKAAFLAGKDFYLHTPSRKILCSVRDFQPGLTVEIRFAQLRLITMVKIPA